jgi:ATP-dependent Lhr-like helicase
VEDRDELAEAVADQLLQRWGVIFYDLAAHENLALPWRELQWALRRLEDRGLVLGGRFVNGFSGEQFALPEAVEAIKLTVRASSSSASPRPVGSGGTGPGGNDPGTVTVCGSDPLNLTGIILPGPRIPARRTQRVTVPC